MLPLFVCKKSRTELEIFMCEQIWRMRRYYEKKKQNERKKQKILYIERKKKKTVTQILWWKKTRKRIGKFSVLVLCSGEAHNVFFVWGFLFSLLLCFGFVAVSVRMIS